MVKDLKLFAIVLAVAIVIGLLFGDLGSASYWVVAASVLSASAIVLAWMLIEKRRRNRWRKD